MVPHRELLPRDPANRHSSFRSSLSQPKAPSPALTNSISYTENSLSSFPNPMSSLRLPIQLSNEQATQEIDRNAKDIIARIIQEMESEVVLEL